MKTKRVALLDGMFMTVAAESFLGSVGGLGCASQVRGRRVGFWNPERAWRRWRMALLRSNRRGTII